MRDFTFSAKIEQYAETKHSDIVSLTVSSVPVLTYVNVKYMYMLEAEIIYCQRLVISKLGKTLLICKLM